MYEKLHAMARGAQEASIVDCETFEVKQHDAVYDQLENTYQQITTRLSLSTGMADLPTIVNGVPIADCDPQLTQIIIAYHFFTLNG